MNSKKIFMIAGPNGAGKTTTARSLFQNDGNDLYEFINADEIARGLAPLHPESIALTASKLMLKRFLQLIEEQKSFAFETTGAAKNYIRHLNAAKKLGYKIHLIYLWLINEDLAIERVSKRVEQGGHFIPENVVRRRFKLSAKNIINEYIRLADSVLIFDNSFNSQKIIAKKSINSELTINHIDLWEQLKRLADDR